MTAEDELKKRDREDIGMESNGKRMCNTYSRSEGEISMKADV